VNRITDRIRQRRSLAQFNRAVRNASPTMQQELLAAASRPRVF
jgi:hypothetical protein